MMSAVAEDRLDLLDPAFEEQMYQCLNCRACEAVCPSGVKYGPLVEAARSQIEQHRPRSAPQRALRTVALGWLFRGCETIPWFCDQYQDVPTLGGMSALARKTGILKLIGMEDAEAMLPPIKATALIPGKESWQPKTRKETAVLFNGCIMGTVFADVNRAAGRVMAHNGVKVEVPVGQQCCGALQVHSGMMDEARVLARKNIESFERSGSDSIIVTAAGCGAALKEYGHLLHEDPEYHDRAVNFSERVKDVTEFLGATEMVKPDNTVNRIVTYQEPCHLAHAQRITAQPRKLLNMIDGLEIIEMKESSLCCGSAGIYNILRKDFADQLGDRKAGNTIATGAQTVTTSNPGCYLQLRTSLKRNDSIWTSNTSLNCWTRRMAANPSPSGR